MATQETPRDTGGMVPTLGLTGVTINAMALIAPGAFLWTTYQLQAAPASAMNMWFAVFVATAIALLTAIAYASLAKRYPEAGAGSSYYFAEISLLQREARRGGEKSRGPYQRSNGQPDGGRIYRGAGPPRRRRLIHILRL